MSRNTRSCLPMAAFLLRLAFSGCSQNPPTAPEKSSAVATPPAAAPPSTTPAAPAALATIDSDLPGLKTAINELKRTSSTLTLKFTVFNNSDTRFSPQGVFDGDSYHRYRHLGGVRLIDGVSKKKYFVVTDSDGSFLSSNEISDIPPKSQITAWAQVSRASRRCSENYCRNSALHAR
jgi:hypothetical protein